MHKLDGDLKSSALSLVEGEKNLIANLANIAALIYHSMDKLNWVGFYLWSEKDQELILGPFQGKPACIRIAPQRGVCGAAYTTKSTQRVHDVNKIPHHIACDAASQSELVIPMLWQGQCVGVLDIDSPVVGRFSEEEAAFFENLVTLLMEKIWGQRETYE